MYMYLYMYMHLYLIFKKCDKIRITKFTLFTILNVHFSGTKYIHIVM